jgi:hypothetical protein
MNKRGTRFSVRLPSKEREGQAVSRSGVSTIRFKQNPIGIWIPEDQIDENTMAERPTIAPILEFALTTVGWMELTGDQPTIEDVIDRLRQYSVRETMGHASRIALSLQLELGEFGQAGLQPNQRLILTRVFGEEAADDLWRGLAELRRLEGDRSNFVLFSERQLLNAVKLSLMAVDHTADDGQRPIMPFFQALLMLNDLIDGEFEGLDMTTEVDRAKLELYTAANLLFNESPHELNDLVRSHFMYVESHSDLKHLTSVDIPTRLERATGLTAEDTWTALLGLLSAWRARTIDEIDRGMIIQRRNQYLGSLKGLTSADRAKWFSLAMWELPELQAEVRRRYSPSTPRFFGFFTEFRERPRGF